MLSRTVLTFVKGVCYLMNKSASVATQIHTIGTCNHGDYSTKKNEMENICQVAKRQSLR